MNQARIIQRQPPDNAHQLPPDLDPILSLIYRNRGISQASELDRTLASLLPIDLMGGLSEAIPLIADIVQKDGRILIVGDFDADGATSCALSVLALRAMGSSRVSYLVPNRFDYGYGLTPEIVELAMQQKPDLIITVDNGISSIAGVKKANEAGIPVVVTDHHLPGETLPDAAAIVNPNVPGNPFPGKATAGVGVIFYVLLGLRAHLRELGWFKQQGINEPNMAEYLDLVALGTVADVVPLDANNRILVHQGLARIRSGRCRPGITALMQIAGRNPARTCAGDMGFSVGPRLNAAGRLDDMSLGIECLLTDSADTAIQLANELDHMNRERRTIEDDMKVQAMALLDSWLQQQQGELPWGLCLFDPEWHQGVIGILASRIKEQFHRPVIAFAPGDEGQIKGSARSIPGLHIRDVLAEVDASHPGILQKYGGHAMAAGMTISADDLQTFSEQFDQTVRRHLSEEDLKALIQSDGQIPATRMTLELAAAIADAGPWGQGFPEPLFDDHFNVINQRVVGERHWKLVLQAEGNTPLIDAIAFNQIENFPNSIPDRIRAAFRLDINEFRGNISLQLRVEHIEAV